MRVLAVNAIFHDPSAAALAIGSEIREMLVMASGESSWP